MKTIATAHITVMTAKQATTFCRRFLSPNTPGCAGGSKKALAFHMKKAPFDVN